MRKRFHPLALGFALLHLLVAAGGPLVDARLEASEQKQAAHLESERATPCAAGHDHLFCQICRVIGVTGNPTASPATFQVAEIARLALEAPQLNPFSRAALVSHGPRAPPVA